MPARRADTLPKWSTSRGLSSEKSIASPQLLEPSEARAGAIGFGAGLLLPLPRATEWLQQCSGLEQGKRFESTQCVASGCAAGQRDRRAEAHHRADRFQ